MITDLTIRVSFTNDEIAQMRQLVRQLDEELYSEGMMPMLKDAAPELYERIDTAACSAIFDFLVENGIRLGYIEFDDEELRRNFEKDVDDGTFEFVESDYFSPDDDPTDEELQEKMYDVWYDHEMSEIEYPDLNKIRSRYSVDEQVDMEDKPEYTCDIPARFLPK